MNERLSDEERAALIAEHARAPLAPGAADDLASMTDLLADPALGAEPPGRLEESVMQSVQAAPLPATSEPGRRGPT